MGSEVFALPFEISHEELNALTVAGRQYAVGVHAITGPNDELDGVELSGYREDVEALVMEVLPTRADEALDAWDAELS